MSMHTKWLSLFLSSFIGIMSLGNGVAYAGDITLYTPYTRISVPPGQSINYTVQVRNNSSEVKTVNLAMSGLPRGWSYTMKSGPWNISQISVLPGKKENVILEVRVPLKIRKGRYYFRVVAGGMATLPLSVIVSKEGTYKTEFTTDQDNMEGSPTSSFTFKTTLKNYTDKSQQYALRTEAPDGWNVSFKVAYKEVTSVNINPNTTTAVTIDIKPPEEIQEGTYKIPVSATTSATSADLDLEVVIKGIYKMELTTPRGLLSTDITAGESKRVELVIRNTGSAELKSISFSPTAPINWKVTFDPKKIDQLGPGQSTHAFATITADKKAIPGDYVTKIEARTAEVDAKASFRVTVKTRMLWGWIGILVILIAIGSVYYLFRKYGRR